MLRLTDASAKFGMANTGRVSPSKVWNEAAKPIRSSRENHSEVRARNMVAARIFARVVFLPPLGLTISSISICVSLSLTKVPMIP